MKPSQSIATAVPFHRPSPSVKLFAEADRQNPVLIAQSSQNPIQHLNLISAESKEITGIENPIIAALSSFLSSKPGKYLVSEISNPFH